MSRTSWVLRIEESLARIDADFEVRFALVAIAQSKLRPTAAHRNLYFFYQLHQTYADIFSSQENPLLKGSTTMALLALPRGSDMLFNLGTPQHGGG